MSFSEQEFQEFKTEALELLELAEKSLLALDEGAEFKGMFDAVFRGFHNLKGAAGMMELTHLQSHTHELETILVEFKESGSIPKPYISLFLRGIDGARSILDGETIEFKYEIDSVQTAEAPPPSMPAEPLPEPPSYPEMDAAFAEFLAECDEIVERVSQHLQVLEKEHQKETVDALYRDFHSLKGAAFLFSAANLGQIAHAMESSLEPVRDGHATANSSLITGLFKCLKVIEREVVAIKTKTPDPMIAQVIPALSRMLQAAGQEQAAPHPDTHMTDATTSDVIGPIVSTPEPIIVDETPAQNSNIITTDPVTPTSPIQEITMQSKTAATPPPAEPTPATPLSATESDASRNVDANQANSTIRVPVALLDNLMTLMGEMVLVRNQVLQFSSKSEDLEFNNLSKRLNVVTSEIQEEMMKTRMQPIGNVVSKFSRIVRDLSNDLKKSIQLQLSGTETELDKSLLEAIKDPLTHIVRNSCDHGIETPEKRRASKKPEMGTIQIRAYHEGGQVVIEVTDDGKGLSRQALIKKAIEKNVITPAQGSQLSEKEAFNLIFAPGFSTAEQVTNVSGRGVGMDVVRTNIEKIGGTVDLSSVEGQGMTIKIKIPLTLAIVPALIVNSGGGLFAIPQVNLIELVRVDQSDRNKIEYLQETPVYRLRGELLPLVDLRSVLNPSAQSSTRERGTANIAVVNADHFNFGLIVDGVQDTADIVVKPINRLLKALQVYSGATILGDGSVALILDTLGISKVAKLGKDKSQISRASLNQSGTRSELGKQDYLLVRLNTPTKHAIVLGYVHRLEEFSRSQIEWSGKQRVIRYRNVLLPVVSANERLGYQASQKSDQEKVAIVVVVKGGQYFGIEVDEIVDTLSTEIELDTSLNRHPCTFGNLNTPEELVVVVDPFELIQASSGSSHLENTTINHARLGMESPASTNAAWKNMPKLKVLVAEDTVFFQKLLVLLLKKAGHEVQVASDGEQALQMASQAQVPFDLIISDIEMPRMNGFELAKSIRKIDRYAATPMMAVSSRADDKYREQGMASGFDLYMEKLKPDHFLTAITQLIDPQRRAT
jgi:two-component system chemotaxis sensor kinase CheA